MVTYCYRVFFFSIYHLPKIHILAPRLAPPAYVPGRQSDPCFRRIGSPKCTRRQWWMRQNRASMGRQIRVCPLAFSPLSSHRLNSYQTLHIYALWAHLHNPVHAGAAWTTGSSDWVAGRDGEGVECAEGE